MPKVFAIFTVSGLALMGVPGLAGFISKWNLVKAALDSAHPLAVVGVAALMISALLTAIYMLTISVRAFVLSPKTEGEVEKLSHGSLASDHSNATEEAGNADASAAHKIVPYDEVKDPGWMMLLPLVLFVAAMLVIGLHPQPLIDAFTQIASAIQ